jgi:hypothetical protein
MKEKQRKVLCNKASIPLMGGILPPLRELKASEYNIYQLKLLSILVRNFKNTSLRVALKRVQGLPLNVEHAFKVFWVSLKIIQIIEPSTRRLCYLLLRNSWNIDFQMFYKDAIERFSQSKRFLNRSAFHRDEYWNYSSIQVDVIECLWLLDPELWIPVTVFPRISFEKESKMELSLRPLDLSSDDIESFRSIMYNFIKSLGIQGINMPPPELVLKVTSARYNDNGTVRRDFEMPTKSLHSGFLYQKFNPKPLQPREVWLPDKATKLNNQFWMIIGREVLKHIPYYPSSDPVETWEKIKHRLKAWHFGYFDFPGFGFQYPREYLVVIAEVITRLYSHPDMYECFNILQKLFQSPVVQMPDGTFKYPPRGIGLGYYEDLKTLGIMGLCHHYKIEPISLYGDQGLVDPGVERKLLDIFNKHQFIITKDRLDAKTVVKWSGWTMTSDFCRRPREFLEPLISSFKAQYHWERKNILKSFAESNPLLYDKYDKYIPFLYEILYGSEFYRGDSLANFRNGGLSSLTPPLVGDLRSWAVERLVTPQDTIVDDIIYETPFYTSWKRAEAKEFSIKRKKLYRFSNKGSTIIRDYATPIINLNDNKKARLPYLATVLSDSAESKLIVNYRQTSGKFTAGLTGDELFEALRLCSRARNPFEAHATGGVSYDTVWKGLSRPSLEWISLAELLTSELSIVASPWVHFYDSFVLPEDSNKSLVPQKRGIKRSSYQISDIQDNNSKSDEFEPRKGLTRITLDMLSNTIHRKDVPRDDILAPVSNILQDMTNREIPITDQDFLYEDEVIDDYLDFIEIE